jgi:TorA maturation chaperone TorD
MPPLKATVCWRMPGAACKTPAARPTPSARAQNTSRCSSASASRTGFLMEKPLAALRDDLARLGLERSEHLAESEDHFAALCDAMRLLHGSIATQKEFFGAHIQPWAGQLFDAIDMHPGAAYYRAVGSLARSFVEVETQAFDMD